MQHVQHEHIDVVMAGASSAPGQQLSLGGDQQAIRRQPVLPGRQFIAKQAHKPNSGLAFVEVFTRKMRRWPPRPWHRFASHHAFGRKMLSDGRVSVTF